MIDYEMMVSSATQKVALLFFKKYPPPSINVIFEFFLEDGRLKKYQRQV